MVCCASEQKMCNEVDEIGVMRERESKIKRKRRKDVEREKASKLGERGYKHKNLKIRPAFETRQRAILHLSYQFMILKAKSSQNCVEF